MSLEFVLSGDPGRPARRFRFSRPRVTVGRDGSRDVVVRSDAASRKHLEFLRHERGWRFRDQGSLNGTVWNGRRALSGPVRPGDELMLGEDGPLIRILRARTPAAAASPAAPAGRRRSRARWGWIALLLLLGVVGALAWGITRGFVTVDLDRLLGREGAPDPGAEAPASHEAGFPLEPEVGPESTEKTPVVAVGAPVPAPPLGRRVQGEALRRDTLPAIAPSGAAAHAMRAARWPVWRHLRGAPGPVPASPPPAPPFALILDQGRLYLGGEVVAEAGVLWCVEFAEDARGPRVLADGEGRERPWLAAGPNREALQLLVDAAARRAAREARPRVVLVAGASDSGLTVDGVAGASDSGLTVDGVAVRRGRRSAPQPPRATVAAAAIPPALRDLRADLGAGFVFESAVPADAPSEVPALRTGSGVWALQSLDVDGVPSPLLLEVEGEVSVAGRLVIGDVPAGAVALDGGARFVPALRPEAGARLAALGSRRGARVLGERR